LAAALFEAVVLDVGLRTVVGVVVRLGVPVVGDPVAGDPVVTGVLLGVVARVVRVLRGVVVAGFAGLLLVGRLVLPPPIVPPPAAGSCCALALWTPANKHTNTLRETRGRRHRVDIKFSPAT
jgi:hypothetical protein